MSKLLFLDRRSYITEAGNTSTVIIDASKASDWSADAYITSLLSDIESNKTLLINMTNSGLIKSLLEQEDVQRDDCSRSVFKLTDAYLSFPDEEKRGAAQAVDEVLSRFTLEIINESYDKESTLIEALLADLSQEAIKASVDRLPGMAEAISNLEAAQVKFRQTSADYQEAKIKKEKKLTASELKLILIERINKLVVYLRAMREAQPEVYGAFADRVAQAIKENNEKVRTRNNRKKTVEEA